jgi:hypothetical protein
VSFGWASLSSANVTVGVNSPGLCDNLGSSGSPFTGIDVNGTITLGNPTAFSAHLDGEVAYIDSSLAFCLRGTANLEIPSLTSSAYGYLYSGDLPGSYCDNQSIQEGLTATVSISADNGNFVTSGTVGVDTTDGSLAVWGNGSINVLGQSFDYTASYCSGADCNGWNVTPGLSGTFTWQNAMTFTVGVTSDDIAVSFSMPSSGEWSQTVCIPGSASSNPGGNQDVCATASYSLDFSLDTASNSVSFTGSASFSSQYNNLPWPVGSGSGPSFGSQSISWPSLSFNTPSIDFGGFVDGGVNALAGILGIGISLPLTLSIPL